MGALDIINGPASASAEGRVGANAIPNAIARDNEIPTNNNQLTNGAGYVTSSGVTSVATGGGLTGGTITGTGTVSHADTSSQGSVNNSGSNFIQDITLDAYGHVTGITSAAAGGSTTTLTGVGTYVLMRTVRQNQAYNPGFTIAPNGDGNERYGGVHGNANASGSGDFQARTDTIQGNPISGGTWRAQSAPSTNQRTVRLMARIS